MRAFITLGLSTLVFLAVAFVPPAHSQAIYQIACEGTESGGGGVTLYQYTVKNVSLVPQTLKHFMVGTAVLDATKYTAPYSPGGSFVFSVVPAAQVPCAFVPFTSMQKTPHGVVPPQQSAPLPGFIYWTHPAGLVLPPGATATFGFTCHMKSQDAEWGAFDAQCAGNVALANVPIAGPVGVYTQGLVHSPTNESVPGAGPWGVGAIILLLLVAGTWALLARRKEASATRVA